MTLHIFNEHIDIYTGNQVFNTRFTHDGNVGIGTTSIANAKLKVAGGGVDIESATDSLRLRFYEGTTFKKRYTAGFKRR